MEQTWAGQEITDEASSPVEASLAAFKRELEDGFGRIGAAAEHLKGITAAIESAGQHLDSSLEAHRDLQAQSSSAVEEARSLLAEMRDMNDQARAAQAESMETRDHVIRMVADLTSLTNDLRTRIAALAVLGQPLPAVETAESDKVTADFSEPAYV